MDKKFIQAVRKMLEDRIPDRDIKKGEKLVGKAEIRKLGPDMVEAIFHEKNDDIETMISIADSETEIDCRCKRFRDSDTCQHVAALAEIIIDNPDIKIRPQTPAEKEDKEDVAKGYKRDPEKVLQVVQKMDPELFEKVSSFLADPSSLVDNLMKVATEITKITSGDRSGDYRMYELDAEAAGWVSLLPLFPEIDQKSFLKSVSRIMTNYARLDKRRHFQGYCSLGQMFAKLNDILESIERKPRNKFIKDIISSNIDDYDTARLIRDNMEIFSSDEKVEFVRLYQEKGRKYSLPKLVLGSKDPDLIMETSHSFSPREVEEAADILVSIGKEKEGKDLLNQELKHLYNLDCYLLPSDTVEFIAKHAPEQLMAWGKMAVQRRKDIHLALSVVSEMEPSQGEVFKKWSKEYIRQHGLSDSQFEIACMDRDLELLKTVSVDNIAFSQKRTRKVAVLFLEASPKTVAEILYAYAIESCDRNPQRKIYGKVARLLRDILDLAERKGIEKPILDAVEKLKEYYARRPSFQEQFRKENL